MTLKSEASWLLQPVVVKSGMEVSSLGAVSLGPKTSYEKPPKYGNYRDKTCHDSQKKKETRKCPFGLVAESEVVFFCSFSLTVPDG